MTLLSRFTLATGLLLSAFGEVGVIYATVVMTVTVVIFSEILPKTLAIAAPDRFAISVAPAVRTIVRVFSPLTRLAQAAREHPVDRHVQFLKRIGARHGPVAAERHPGAQPEQRPDPVLPGGPCWPDERHGEVVVLCVVAGPQRLEVRGDAELREPLKVGGADELKVGDVMPCAHPLRVGQGGERVERGADRPVADRVEVHLEAEVGQLDAGLPQFLWLNEQ